MEKLVSDMSAGLERLRQVGGGAWPTRESELSADRLLLTFQRAAELAGRLVAYAGGQSLAPERLELLPFLCDFAHRLRGVLDARIDVSVDVGQDCPPCYADADALEAALLDLVVNARDAMPDGGRLRLAARQEPMSDGRAAVALSVSDSGTGIAADLLHRAAQPFVTTKSHDPLAGLGLSAADGFARQSGGRLTLRTWVSGGVMATLSLPLAP